MKPAVFTVVVVILLFTGCSLNYGTVRDTESSVPEFIFTDTVFVRYENGAQSMKLNAAELEQYKDNNSVFARDVAFTTFSGAGKAETEGSCGYVSADSKTGQYTFFNSIRILNHVRDIQIFTERLHWNSKTEQLTGDRNGSLTVKHGNTTLTGTGFSASGISSRFTFEGPVTGAVIMQPDAK